MQRTLKVHRIQAECWDSGVTQGEQDRYKAPRRSIASGTGVGLGSGDLTINEMKMSGWAVKGYKT